MSVITMIASNENFTNANANASQYLDNDEDFWPWSSDYEYRNVVLVEPHWDANWVETEDTFAHFWEIARWRDMHDWLEYVEYIMNSDHDNEMNLNYNDNFESNSANAEEWENYEEKKQKDENEDENEEREYVNRMRERYGLEWWWRVQDTQNDCAIAEKYRKWADDQIRRRFNEFSDSEDDEPAYGYGYNRYDDDCGYERSEWADDYYPY